MIENEAVGENSPSRKKRLALDCADSVRVSRGLGTGLTARQKREMTMIGKVQAEQGKMERNNFRKMYKDSQWG